MPGGICRSSVCAIAVTCAFAVLMSTVGWKKILMTPKPVYEVGLDVLDVVDRRGQRALETAS